MRSKLFILGAFLAAANPSFANEAYCPQGELVATNNVAKCVIHIRNYVGDTRCRGRDAITFTWGGQDHTVTLDNPGYVVDASGNTDKCRYTWTPPKPNCPPGAPCPTPSPISKDVDTICPNNGDQKEINQGHDRCYAGWHDQPAEIRLR